MYSIKYSYQRRARPYFSMFFFFFFWGRVEFNTCLAVSLLLADLQCLFLLLLLFVAALVMAALPGPYFVA